MSSMSRDAGLYRTTQFSAAFAVAIFSLAVVAHCSDNNSEVKYPLFPQIWKKNIEHIVYKMRLLEFSGELQPNLRGGEL